MIVRDLGLKAKEVKIFRGKGCPNCNFTGFFGRTAIYEILLVDETIRELILRKSSSDQIKRAALSRGMQTLRKDGWHKVLAGVTTPEEVMEVTADTIHMEHEESDKKAQISVNLESPDLPRIQGAGTNNKRAYSRLNGRINLRYKAYKSKEELRTGFVPEQLSVTKNISAGGILFASDEAFAVGTVLELKIELPDSKEAVECLARMIRIEEIEAGKSYNIAANFLDMTSAQRVRLNKYIEGELETG